MIEQGFWRVTMPAAWPAPPELYSFSALAEIEACPRRWSLRHASYPHWDGQLYPDRPSVAALKGTVVHRALELLCKRAASGTGPAGGDPAGALRELGGFTALIHRAIDEVMQRETGPRSAHVSASLRRSLGLAVAELRRELQAMVARLDVLPLARADALPKPPDARADGAGGSARRQVGRGTHSEVGLVATHLRLKGVVDLLAVHDDGVDIVDFKTGTAQPHHEDQLRLYGLLWAADSARNPSGIPVRTLRLSYVGEDVVMRPCSEAEAATAGTRQQARAMEADRHLSEVPPRAIPTLASCTFCSVKQLCPEFWSQGALPDDRRPVRFVDATMRIKERLGERTWSVVLQHLVPGPSAPVAVLRNVPSGAAYRAGDDVTVLGGLLRADDTEAAIGLTATSEIFRGVCLTSQAS